MFQTFTSLREQADTFKTSPRTRRAHGGSNEAESDEPVHCGIDPTAEGNIGRGKIRARPTLARFCRHVAERVPAPAAEFDVMALLIGPRRGEIADERADQHIG